jgi:FkbM family methyltransferase
MVGNNKLCLTRGDCTVNVKRIRNYIKNLILYLLGVLPWGKNIEARLMYKVRYKNNLDNIKFQGQYFQDMMAYMYLEKKKTGFFIDIGANNGLYASNTYVFEQLGWKGICVEPQPDIYKLLAKFRKCDCYNVALSLPSVNGNKEVDFFKAYGINYLSRINKGMTDSAKNEAKEYGKVEIIKVKTMTFEELMGNYTDIRYIDFMSIDVEGCEVDILEMIDFSKYAFGFIAVEKSDPAKIKEIMKRNGYRIFMEIGADLMFVPQYGE